MPAIEPEISFLFSEGFLSSVNPYLLQAEIAAAVVLGIGIIYESDKFPKSVHRSAFWFVVIGVFLETVFSISLFASEEEVASLQRSKIIALETRIAPRVLTTEQYDAIQALRGKVKTVSVLSSPDVEPAMFSAQLQEALSEAGVSVTPIPAPSGVRYVGTQICLPKNEAPNDNPLWETFSAIGLTPALCSLESITLPVAKDAPLIIIGAREPFFPGGAPRSLRFRAYPGLDITRKQQ